MGKRYGQRPSSLLPRKSFHTDEQALAFDLNVMLVGMEAERKAQEEVMNEYRPKGMTTSRRAALSLARRARTIANEAWDVN